MMTAERNEDAKADAKADAAGERYRRVLERGMADYAFDAERFDRAIANPSSGPSRMDRLVLATDAVTPPPDGLDPAERVRALVSDPAFQLK